MDEIPTDADIGEAVVRLMKLAKTALDAGRIDDASSLLRLAAAAAENDALLRKIGTSPDAALPQMAADPALSEQE